MTGIEFTGLEKIISSLATLPNLIDLKINLSTQNEALMILENLPKLQYLNGKTTKDDTHLVDIEDKDIEEISLNLEVSTFNEVYKKISEILKQINKELTKSFHEEFYKMLREEIANINQSVENTIPNYIYASKVLASKIKIYKYFFDTLTDKAIPFTTDSEAFALLKDLNDKLKINSDLMCDIMNKLYPKINEKSEQMKKQIEEALKGAHVVDEELKTFEDKIAFCNKERDYVINQANEEKQLMLSKIEMLEKENKEMTEKLISNAKLLIANNEKQPLESSLMVNNKRMSSAPKKLEELNPNLKHGKNFYNNLNRLSPGQGGDNENVNYSQIVVSSRVLTIKMLKEIIEEIYKSKTEYDEKCREYKMPRETMEQHMYSYLNQKYGLKVSFFKQFSFFCLLIKNLIIEWATSIINGIKQYSHEDSEICLFGKILRNEIDEEGRFVIMKLKYSMTDIIKVSFTFSYILVLFNWEIQK